MENKTVIINLVDGSRYVIKGLSEDIYIRLKNNLYSGYNYGITSQVCESINHEWVDMGEASRTKTSIEDVDIMMCNVISVELVGNDCE